MLKQYKNENKFSDINSKDIETCLDFVKEICKWNHPDVRKLSPQNKKIIASLMSKSIRKNYKLSKFCKETKKNVYSLNQRGYLILENLISLKKIKEIKNYFKNIPCLNAHIDEDNNHDNIRRDLKNNAQKFSFGTYTQEEIFKAPHLLKIFTSKKILDIIECYLEARPMIFSLNTFWSFPKNEKDISFGQDFHRDNSHTKFLVLFLYLTDCNEDNGAHQFIKFSHSEETLQKYLDIEYNSVNSVSSQNIKLKSEKFFNLEKDGRGFTSLYNKYLSNLIVTHSAQAGTGIIENTFGLHRGLIPQKKPRLMAWARYSLFPVVPNLKKFSFKNNHKNIIPKNERSLYSLRAISLI